MQKRNVYSVLVILLIVMSWSSVGAAELAEILWDDWGVPHIFAANPEDAFYAQGWAPRCCPSSMFFLTAPTSLKT